MDKELLELVAIAMVGEQGYGHNDPPLYDDYNEDYQKILRSRARILIEYLKELGLTIERG